MTGQTSRYKLSLMAGACAAALLAAAPGARADIMIQCQTPGGVPGQTTPLLLGCSQGQVNSAFSNILFNDAAAVTSGGNTVKGLTNTSPKTLFDFTSTTDALQVNNANSGGAATIVSTTDDVINNLKYNVDVTQPYGSTSTGFTELDTNLDTRQAGGTVTFTIHALSASNPDETFTSVAFGLGNGDNKYAFIAQNGETIKDISFTTSGAVSSVSLDVKQTQVTLNGNAVPIVEPSSLAMLGGSLVAMGIALRRRKRSGAAERAEGAEAA